MSELFPLFLKLAGRRVVVVGGGYVAAAKVATLRGTGAEVVVVSPRFHPELEAADVDRRPREFRPADLEGAWLVIAAAVPEVNAAVAREAEHRRIFTIAVDDPASCSAYAGGVVRKGEVVAAVSTSGRAPALAGLLREALEAVLPDELDAWVELASRLRVQHRAAQVPMAQRRPLLLAALEQLYPRRSA